MICFEEKCDPLESHCAEILQNCVRYFQDRLRPQLKTKVSDPKTKVSDPKLDDKVDSHWINNKQAIDWKSKPLKDLVDTLYTIVQGQYHELRAALIGSRKYHLPGTH
ncbi:hypothetical protein DPMN_073632 [Dreissena polymorpha]|uniref:Uncharacterized protein n=1 Tax=Dreissena polymorpha TaxID=45954 RepID=A0A9D4HBC9_DREPO|nr:hypothetical protein DPMN_073632 [Dreissena polymorpha]